MSGDDLIQACLEELRGAEGMGALVRLVGDRAAVLLGTPGVASGLVAGAPQSEDPDRVRRLRLLQALIGQAARDRDGRGRLGARFLEDPRSPCAVQPEPFTHRMQGWLALVTHRNRGRRRA